MENIVTTTQSSSKFPLKFLIIGIIILVLVLGIVAAVFLTRQPQDVEEKAATPTGVAKVFITPESKTVNVDEEFTADVLLDTSGQFISALTIQLEYSYTGSEPSIEATEIQASTDLMTNKEWTFPVKTVNATNGKVIIRIAGFNKSINGFKSTGEEKIATVKFEAVSNGTVNISFNSTESKVTSKTTTQDILLIPSSKAVFTAQGGSSSPTPTPTGSASPKPSGSASPKPSGSATPAPIPVTGASTPTIIGVSLGVILLVGSLSLIF